MVREIATKINGTKAHKDIVMGTGLGKFIIGRDILFPYLHKDEFDKCIADNASKLVVVDFTATWCGPCKRIGPYFAGLEDKYPDCVFIKVDVDTNKETSEACGISCMPTFHCYKNGIKVDEFSGASEDKLVEMINKNK